MVLCLSHLSTAQIHGSPGLKNGGSRHLDAARNKPERYGVFTPLPFSRALPAPFKIKYKGSPSAGWKRPSRDDVERTVMMGMKTLLRQKNGRRCVMVGRLGRITGLAKVLAGILLLPLLVNSAWAVAPANPAGDSINLVWDANPDALVTGYNIYYGSSTAAYNHLVQVGNVNSASIYGLVAGATYFFTATAYYADGTESDFSNEISRTLSATIPALEIHRAAAGQFALTVNGRAGQTLQILATTDLIAWTVIGTVIIANSGSLEFTDSEAARYPARFYRTQAAP
jgi:hypothetical protein